MSGAFLLKIIVIKMDITKIVSNIEQYSWKSKEDIIEISRSVYKETENLEEASFVFLTMMKSAGYEISISKILNIPQFEKMITSRYRKNGSFKSIALSAFEVNNMIIEKREEDFRTVRKPGRISPRRVRSRTPPRVRRQDLNDNVIFGR